MPGAISTRRQRHSGKASQEVDLEILRGDLLLARPDPQPGAAAAAYERAVGVAEARGTRMTRLQALTRLAGLRRGTAGETATRAALRDMFESSTEGFGSAPLLAASALLDGAPDQSRG